MVGAISRRVLICGSVACNTIMNFDGFFRDQILPDRMHMLSVAFLVPRLRGTQKHRFARSEFYSRYRQNFGVRAEIVGASAPQWET